MQLLTVSMNLRSLSDNSLFVSVCGICDTRSLHSVCLSSEILSMELSVSCNNLDECDIRLSLFANVTAMYISKSNSNEPMMRAVMVLYHKVLHSIIKVVVLSLHRPLPSVALNLILFVPVLSKLVSSSLFSPLGSVVHKVSLLQILYAN